MPRIPNLSSPTTSHLRNSLLSHHHHHHLCYNRSFSLRLPAPLLSNKPLPPRLKIEDADLTISYLKGTGPGGQKINKTNSAVQLIHKPTGIVVKSQATRSRSQNEKIARQILADKVEELLKGDESRVALKAERERKKKASKVKKSRRKYRDLDKAALELESPDRENGNIAASENNDAEQRQGQDKEAR